MAPENGKHGLRSGAGEVLEIGFGTGLEIVPVTRTVEPAASHTRRDTTVVALGPSATFLVQANVATNRGVPTR
jgi:hypothetical protein